MKILVLVLLVFSFTKTNSQVLPPPCNVVNNKIKIHPLLTFSDSAIAAMLKYRGYWKNICNESDSLSFYKAYMFVDTLESILLPEILKDFSKKYNDKQAHSVEKYLNNKIPQILPGLVGRVFEHEYIALYPPYFLENSKMGLNIDRQFWKLKNYVEGQDLAPIWFSRTWDYGGCHNYGGYDPIKIFNEIDFLKKMKLPKGYTKTTDYYEEELKGMYTFKMPNKEIEYLLCSCEGMPPIIQDLKKLIKYFSDSNDSEIVKILKNSLAAVESGKIIVGNDAVKHCSGG
jgi:hypothetical protein